MLKSKVPLQSKRKKKEARNKKCIKSFPMLNHRYAVKSKKKQIFRRKTQKGIENPDLGAKP